MLLLTQQHQRRGMAKTSEGYTTTPREVKTQQEPQKRQLGLFHESAEDV